MQSLIHRILLAIRRKRRLSASRADRMRREARDFAAQLLDGYALQTAQQRLPRRN